jgi:hypothetical protein
MSARWMSVASQLKSAGYLNYCYNADGELVSEQSEICANPGSGLQEGFTCDPEGQLASATTAGDNAGTTLQRP